MDDFWDGGTTTTHKPVVDMADRRQAVHYAPLRQIESYWTALRGNRPMPLRSEIDPRGLKGALEHCFVLERIAPGIARLRVAGSHLGDLMGMEVRGMPMSSFLTPDSRQQYSEALEEVFETPATATVLLSAETSFGRPPMQARMALLPVRSDLGDTSRILGGFVAVGDIGRIPRRFKVDMIKINPILVPDAVPMRPDGPTVIQSTPSSEVKTARIRRAADGERGTAFPAPLPTQPVQAAEADAEFAQAIPGVPYLRVVK